MLLDFHKLYEPYSKDANLEETLLWLEQQAKILNIPEDVRNACIAEVFLEMAQGKMFGALCNACDPPCAFHDEKIELSHVEMNHYTLRKMQRKAGEIKRAHVEMLMSGVNEAIVAHMAADNEAFLKEHAVQKNTWQRIKEWIGIQS